MGWKAVRDHYRITHIVRRRDDEIWVGSGYLPSLIVIGQEGEVSTRYNGGDEDLSRYQREMDADPAKLRELVACEDRFETGVPIYTYDGCSIVEKRCEEPGWPNVTHDGEVMYENTHFTTRTEAVRRALSNAQAAERMLSERIAEMKAELQEALDRLATWTRGIEKLSAEAGAADGETAQEGERAAQIDG